MKKTRNLSRIAEILYGKVWAVTPTTYHSYRRQFEAAIANPTKLIMEEMEPEEEDEDESLININIPADTALINVDGTIGKRLSQLETMCGGVDIEMVSNQLTLAMNNPAINNIVLLFNSPGGTVTGVPELGEKINEYSKIKNIVGVTDTLCASAGYWLASQCTSFYCSPSSDVGSIGVYSLFMDETSALEREGLKVVPISAGKFKLMGASFREMSKEELDILQNDVNKIYTQFKSAILSNRPHIADSSMQGLCYSGDTAVELGLADGTINNWTEVFNLLPQETTNVNPLLTDNI